MQTVNKQLTKEKESVSSRRVRESVCVCVLVCVCVCVCMCGCTDIAAGSCAGGRRRAPLTSAPIRPWVCVKCENENEKQHWKENCMCESEGV